MKVISGVLKGRNIMGFTIDGTRPTMDRVKESMFAMIQNHIPNSVVLDLFSGSGNLGIESISNGSKKVYFNDVSKEAIKVIQNNIEKFNISEFSVILNYDYELCLKYLRDKNVKLDVIFLDPPYKSQILNDVIKRILYFDLLNDSGIIVCEVGNNYLNEFDLLQVIKQRRYGDKYLIIYKKSCK